MIAAFNALPRTADTTEGFFSRWVVVPFSAFFPAGRADPVLIDRLVAQANLQGLLRYAVGGLQAVMRRGSFSLPASVINATQRFKQEADPLRAFLDECVVSKHPNDTAFVPRTEFYVRYTSWGSANGFHQMSAARFYESLLAAAADAFEFPVKSVKTNGVFGYRGMELR
jgi:putative DNA primase/helicase